MLFCRYFACKGSDHMRKIQIDLLSSGLVLEACLDLPPLPGPFPGVVLCHPHPLYGGNMDNNVILAVSRALNSNGIASLRFNFRGVGRSQGSFANGIGEQEDAQAALLLLTNREEIDPARIGIMGYSFGGMVALAVGGRSDIVKAIAAVSPVIPLDPDVFRKCTKPKLFVIGAEDNIIPPSMVLRKTTDMVEPKAVEVIPGADHFWWGYEEKVGDIMAGFFAEILV